MPAAVATSTSPSVKTGVVSVPAEPVKVMTSVFAPALKFQMPVPATRAPTRNAALVASSAAYAPPVLIAKPLTSAIGPIRKSTRSRQCDARSRNSPAPAFAGSKRQLVASAAVVEAVGHLDVDRGQPADGIRREKLPHCQEAGQRAPVIGHPEWRAGFREGVDHPGALGVRARHRFFHEARLAGRRRQERERFVRAGGVAM